MDDADADPTNELQVISISNNTIYLTRGGFIKLPSSSGNGSTEDDATKGVEIGGKVHLSEFDNDFSRLDKNRKKQFWRCGCQMDCC